MADSSQSDKSRKDVTGREKRLDEDLEILEKHAAEIDDIESTIQEDMRRWDREYKDSHLHSVPRPRKHTR